MHLPFRGRRPSPAMGVAFLALILAVSGTAVALPGRNLITSDDIKRGAVKNPDIGRGAVSTSKLRNGAVSTSKLRNGAVSTAKLGNNAVTGAKINESSLGPVPSATTANTAGSLSTLPPGQSQSGTFSAGGANDAATGYIGAGITYRQPLAQPIPNANIVDTAGAASAPHCPGAGQADPGYLCLYNRVLNGVAAGYGYSDTPGYFSTPSNGVVLYWPVTGVNAYAGGQYTVTAP
jgi:hypothetical protein